MRDNVRFLDELQAIVGRRYVLTSPESTRRYRTGFRFGTGPALAVVRPGNLVEQWRVLKACAAANKIIIMQAANTGITGGSTPDGSDYDREIVIVSTMRLAKIRLIKPALLSHYKGLDPCNCFNPGIGRTSKHAHWRLPTSDQRAAV
jgi:D-lactate dehydrogenase